MAEQADALGSNPGSERSESSTLTKRQAAAVIGDHVRGRLFLVCVSVVRIASPGRNVAHLVPDQGAVSSSLTIPTGSIAYSDI